MKIYIITSGEYSSYHICAVATDPEKADQLAEFFTTKYDTAGVEEYDTEDLPDLTKGKKVFNVRFNKRGEMDGIYESPEEFRSTNVMLYADCSVSVIVQANTKEAAIKIGAERRAKFLAENMGL